MPFGYSHSHSVAHVGIGLAALVALTDSEAAPQQDPTLRFSARHATRVRRCGPDRRSLAFFSAQVARLGSVDAP
jgi:hypothetical protein